MILGHEKYFSKKHFENNKGLSLSYLSELVVYCLELVSQLSYSKLHYRFKGGNSLLILLENPKRFSIDVDIATTVSKNEMINVVEEIVDRSDIFIKYEARKPRTKPWLPIISFKLFFNSFYQKPEDSFVMLDAVLEEPPYGGIIKPVKCLDIYKSNETVEVPTVSGLIGDKLLTIGPSTLGIPLDKNKEAHRLKHIFDIALLTEQTYQINDVYNSLTGCMEQENTIQKTNFSLNEVCEDTIDFCSQALKFELKPDHHTLKKSTYLYEIAYGFDDFRQHLFSIDYTWDLFKESCQKVIEIFKKIKVAH